MDMFSLWERILSYVEKNDHQYYDMFLSQLSPCSFAGGVFTIAANKPFLIPWIKICTRRRSSRSSPVRPASPQWSRSS